MKSENTATNMPEMADIVPNWFPSELMAWKPREQLKISEWTEKYRILKSGEEKGPVRLIRTPFFRDLLDWLTDPDIVEVVLMKPAQIGGTQATISAIGYYSHQDSCPILMILADEETAKWMCRDRIQPMYRDSPELEKLIGKIFKTDEIKLVNNSYITIAWASSVAQLGSKEFKIVVMDEIDKPGYYAKSKEASALSLARERSETFYSRKHFLLSTPTLESGNITQELMSCDIIFDWHVPCPECGQFQPLRWGLKYTFGFENGLYRGDDDKLHAFGQVIWENGRDATKEDIEAAAYECGECQALWSTVQKNNAVENGKMVARESPRYKPRKIGLHVNRLYSLLGNSGDISVLVRRFLDDFNSRDPKRIQGFVNSAMAEPWRETVAKTSESDVLKAVCDLEAMKVPEKAIVLTAGIDVQAYGFWFVVRAWTREFESWLIHYGFLSTWTDVEQLLFVNQYPTEGLDGQFKRIWRAGIDTGGGLVQDVNENMVSMTEQTYFWLRANQVGKGARVFGTKGASRPMESKIKIGKALDKTPSGKALPGGIQVIQLDTGQLKDMYHYRLNLAIQSESGPMTAHLCKDVGQDYVRHVTAEEKRIEDGQQVWKQIRAENHLLDCEVICMAAAEPEFPGGGVNLIPDEIMRKESSLPKSENKWIESKSWINKKGSSWINR